MTSAFAQYYPAPAYVRPTYAPVPVAYRPAVVPVPTARYVAAPRVVAPVAPLVKSANPEAGAAVVQEYRDVSFDGNFNYG